MRYEHGETREQADKRREITQNICDALGIDAQHGKEGGIEHYTDAIGDVAYAIVHGMVEGVKI